MRDDASNRELLAAWQGGNQRAAALLVRRYLARLTALARCRLSRRLARRLDPEDIVLSAWRSFFVATNEGRLTVPDGDELWPLLATLTLRKLARQTARQHADRRNVQRETEANPMWNTPAAFARDPSPEAAAILADEVQAVLKWLAPADREVLTRRLQGQNQATIAAALRCSERSIGRAMQRIRETLSQRNDADASPWPAIEFSARPATLPAISVPPLANLDDEQFAASPTISYADVLLQQFVGQGGFGKVYRALRRTDGETVAVKFLKKRFWHDPRATQQLIAEVQRAADIRHPQIVRYHGWGRSPHGALFVVLDWVPGRNARDWASGSQPSWREIATCGLQIAAALAAAHAAGVVHGDVTPSNVLRRDDGRFLLIDFGFARSPADSTPSLGGTLGFLAPEQVSDAFGSMGPHTDVYGLGGLLYALISGHPPTVGDTAADVLARVISSQPPPTLQDRKFDLPVKLRQLIVACLHKEPGDRPTVATVREQLLLLP